jgi:hypothetical protein
VKVNTPIAVIVEKAEDVAAFADFKGKCLFFFLNYGILVGCFLCHGILMCLFVCFKLVFCLES